jgi:hypothetical protein
VRRFHLYVDDSGSRYPDRVQKPPRLDGMDYFALGGILIDEAEIGAIFDAHSTFTARWNLTGPLHSTKIRGSRGAFSWLASDKKQGNDFLSDLHGFISI